jgi:hypothetical protein
VKGRCQRVCPFRVACVLSVLFFTT